MDSIHANIRQSIQDFDFTSLFIGELSWDHFSEVVRYEIDDTIWELKGVANKRGFQVFHCPNADAAIRDRALRQRIDNRLAKDALEHLIIFTDAGKSTQR